MLYKWNHTECNILKLALLSIISGDCIQIDMLYQVCPFLLQSSIHGIAVPQLFNHLPI